MENNHRPKLDIGPLPQPSSAEIRKLIRRGLVYRLDCGASPIEDKQQKVIERYIGERGTLAAILAKTQKSLDIASINEAAKNDINRFTLSERSAQLQMHRDVISHTDLELTRIFAPNLDLHKELLAEKGFDAETVRIDISFWERSFKNSPRAKRIDVATQLKEGNDNMLRERFPFYLERWKKMLAEKMGCTKDEVKVETAKLEDDFGRASDIGKAGISKTLREKIFEASNVSFTLGLGILRKLRTAEGITVDSDRFPDPLKLAALYQSSSLEGRQYIENLTREACDRLIAHAKRSKRP